MSAGAGAGAGGGFGGGANPEGVLRIFAPTPGATRIVLLRHGQAECNVSRVVGGVEGCHGLTDLGRRQVEAVVTRLAASGELTGATALYSSVLPRARETAELLRPVVGTGSGSPLKVVARCDLCELHPGQADNLSWDEVIARFGLPDWDIDPDQVIAPGGESWNGFVARAGRAVRAVAAQHQGELVVAAVHAGVIEATMIDFLAVPRSITRRGWLRIAHASLTEWEWVAEEDRWILLRFNDAFGVPKD